MILILTLYSECFQSNAQLIGIVQQTQYNLIIENIVPSPLNCLEVNNTLSNAILNYGSGRSISTQFQYYSDRNLSIYFEKIADNIFQEILKKKVISYTLQLGQQQDFIGSFISIKNVITNTSNCWGEMKLIYQRSGKTSFINITAEPNDCRIENPTVVFQFNVDYEWKSILIKPEESPPSDYKGFKVPFVQKDTLFYEQAYSDMDEENQKQLDFFFTSFTADRNMLMRLSLDFTLVKAQLYKSITSDIIKIQSSNIDCLKAIDARVSISTNFLVLFGYQPKLLGCIDNFQTLKAYSTAVFNNETLHYNQDLVVLSTMSGIPFSFQQPQDITLQQQIFPITMIYLTIYESDGTIVREEALQYESVASCFSKIKPLVSFKETCLILFQINTERCQLLYENGVQTRFQQVLQEKASSASRIAYQVYQFNMFITTEKYQKICFNEDQVIIESEYPFEKGDYFNRQKAYVKKLSKVYQPLSFFVSNIDLQFSYESALDENGLLTPLIVSTFGVFLIITIICMFILLHNSIQ